MVVYLVDTRFNFCVPKVILEKCYHLCRLKEIPLIFRTKYTYKNLKHSGKVRPSIAYKT